MRSRMALAAGSVLVVGLAGWAALPQPAGDYEKQVRESEVPRPALEALKKLAAGAPFTEFAEEVEHGRKFYEGSWKGPHGHIDALVTAAGDVVEIEEAIPADNVPGAARAEATKEAGKEAMTFEKKTVIMYEVHYKKDGKARELILLPDGQRYREHDGADVDKDEDEEKAEKQK